MQSYNGSLKKRFWEVNYQLVGKELAEDLKFLSQNPWNENASFRQRGPEKQENARKKNLRWRAKFERPLVVSLTICEVNEMHL